jgi:DNA-binding transcriptional LysR family regulator
LEKILGTKLFFRESSGLVLTSDGKQLYHYIDKSFNYMMAGEKIIKENNNMDYGTIVIGSPAHIASFYLLPYIEEYRKKHPNVFIRIINGSTSELLAGLQNHTIDFVIDSSPIKLDSQEMKIEPLLSFDTCIITQVKNKDKKIRINDLNYVMPYARSSIRKNLEKVLKKYNLSLNVILEVETTDLIIKSVKGGIGSGYVVKKAVENELKNGELLELETEFDLPKLELNLVYIEDYVTNISNYFIKNYIKK